MQDFVEKIASFEGPVEKSFTGDDGNTVKYSVFELGYSINGVEHKMELKTKSISDKIALLSAADKVE